MLKHEIADEESKGRKTLYWEVCIDSEGDLALRVQNKDATVLWITKEGLLRRAKYINDDLGLPLDASGQIELRE